jgi:TPR repeat protein
MTKEWDLFEEGDAREDAGDFDGARQSFEQGAKLGDPGCLCRLGLMFDRGVGCPIDKTKAMSCYKRAWRSRDLAAAQNIAIIYREAGKPRLMSQWFKRAASAGDGDALVEMARCYLDGIGVRKDIAAAKRALEAAIISENITEYSQEIAESMLADLKSSGAQTGG